jgi:anti-anti-sigma factor
MILRTSLSPELEADLVSFHGELDASAAPDFGARLAEVAASPPPGLVIDLCACTFIDSLGIAALVEGSRAMLDQRRPVAVAASSSQVRRILTLVGVDDLVPVRRTRGEAVELLAAEL